MSINKIIGIIGIIVFSFVVINAVFAWTGANIDLSNTVTTTSTIQGVVNIKDNLILGGGATLTTETETLPLKVYGFTPTGDNDGGGDVDIKGGTGGIGGQAAGQGGNILITPGGGTGLFGNGYINLGGSTYIRLNTADALYLAGSNTSTFWADGRQITIGASINASGTITQNGTSVLTTSTGLGVANFASANISQWTNNSNYLTTSTNLGISNFTTSSISQWANNSGYITTSTYNIPGQSCGGSDKVSTISATGTIVCTTDQTGTGGDGTVTTSTPVSANYFPFWNADNGSGLNGTSTLFRSGLALFTGSTFNASGTISQNGVAVITTSTGLGVSNFASANISQWTNDNNYITSSTVSGIFPIIWGSATGSISISNSPSFTGTLSADTLNATTSMKLPLLTTALTSNGQLGISNASATLNFFASSTQWILNPEQCNIDFVLDRLKEQYKDYVRR